MHWRRAGLVIAPALLVACSPEGGEAQGVETPAADAPAAPVVATRSSDPVPERLLARWIYVRDECEPDAEDTPEQRRISAELSLDADSTYFMVVEGFPFTGTYRYEGGESPRIQLDGSLLNFAVEADTLQNWSEGDAVYQCGRVFVREGG